MVASTGGIWSGEWGKVKTMLFPNPAVRNAIARETKFPSPLEGEG
jgi:hypothetical protein